jgi:IMP dehydrogenase/GMP reductase
LYRDKKIPALANFKQGQKMNEELFNSREALTFDDVLVVPAYSEVLPSEVNVNARLTRDILLHIPVLAAAMDTVTEARLAVAPLCTATCRPTSKPTK